MNILAPNVMLIITHSEVQHCLKPNKINVC